MPRIPLAPELVQEVCLALRRLRNRPSFTLSVVVTLTLAVGAGTAIFSLVDAAYLRPLPVDDESRVMLLYQASPDGARANVSPANFLDWRAAESFEALVAYAGYEEVLSAPGPATRVVAAGLDGDLFTALGVPLRLGRSWGQHGSDLDVAVISHDLWFERFGGDTDVIGRKVRVNDRDLEVIGVATRDFEMPVGTDLWMPRPIGPRQAEIRGGTWLTVVGRLADGATEAEARGEMKALGARLARDFPDDNEVVSIAVVPVREALTDGSQRFLGVLAAAVGCLLLVACANLANLMLARGRERRVELGVRMALGASRGVLLRQMLIEAVVLALPGGVGAALAAGWLLELFLLGVPETMVWMNGLGLDLRVFALGLGLTLATSLVFGLLPALHQSGIETNRTLRPGARTTSDAGSLRFGRLLVVAEVVLAVILVVGATLLGTTLRNLFEVDLGFQTDNRISFRVALPERYDQEARADFYRALLERLRGLPEVESAGGVAWLPLGGLWSCDMAVEGRSEDEDLPVGQFRPATPGYFATASIPLLEGRAFDAGDRRGAPLAAVVDQRFANTYFPDGDAVGRRFDFGCAGGDEAAIGPWTIVGVVGSVRQYGAREGVQPGYYLSADQIPWSSMSLVLRTDRNVAAVAPAIRAAVAELDSTVPVNDIETLDDRRAGALSQPQFLSALFGAFAALALAIGSLGVYSVLAYGISRRRHELGVRAALGADRGILVSLVIKEGLSLVGVGLALGLGAALVVSRGLESLLWGVEASDPAVYLATALTLATAGLAASWLPARSAANVDVTEVLRHE